jgi:hypothetical protein
LNVEVADVHDADLLPVDVPLHVTDVRLVSIVDHLFIPVTLVEDPHDYEAELI